MNSSLYLNFFIALLAISNPIGKVPLWVRAAANEERRARWWLAIMVSATGAAILAFFLVFGSAVLEMFSIDLASFRIGGGVIVLLVGIRMLNGKATQFHFDFEAESHQHNELDRAKVRLRRVLVPLVVPFIAGPASISTVTIYGMRANGTTDYAVMLGVMMVIMLITFLVLLSARHVERWVGPLVLEIQTRLFGIILAAVATQLIVAGLRESFPVLGFKPP